MQQGVLLQQIVASWLMDVTFAQVQREGGTADMAAVMDTIAAVAKDPQKYWRKFCAHVNLNALQHADGRRDWLAAVQVLQMQYSQELLVLANNLCVSTREVLAEACKERSDVVPE